jgi:hypothetical protein
LSRGSRADRAFAFLWSPAGRQFLNDLDAQGWMLCLQGEALPDGRRWPVPIGTRGKYPSWCNHEFSASEMAKAKRAKLQPKLKVIEGDKKDGPTEP